jgi:hypothetical protein
LKNKDFFFPKAFQPVTNQVCVSSFFHFVKALFPSFDASMRPDQRPVMLSRGTHGRIVLLKTPYQVLNGLSSGSTSCHPSDEKPEDLISDPIPLKPRTWRPALLMRWVVY